MMLKTEQEWNKFIDDWQQNPADSNNTVQMMKTEEKHLKTMANKVKLNSRLSKLGVAFILLVMSVLAIPLVNEMLIGLPSKFDYVFYYTMLSMVILGGAIAIWYQLSSIKKVTKDSTEFVGVLLKQNRSVFKAIKVLEFFGFGLLVLTSGIVLWLFIPSLIAGTLVADLGSVAKPFLGSIILLGLIASSLALIFTSRMQQRHYTEEGKTLEALVKDFQ